MRRRGLCGGRARCARAEESRGSGVVVPSKDIQGLEMDGASADQQSPERATRIAPFPACQLRVWVKDGTGVSNCSPCISGQVSRELAVFAVARAVSGARYFLPTSKMGPRLTRLQHVRLSVTRTRTGSVASSERRWQGCVKAQPRPRLPLTRPLHPLSSNSCECRFAKISADEAWCSENQGSGRFTLPTYQRAHAPCSPIVLPRHSLA
ncbi:hypothetical protein BKA58DRAFT_243025 [Alternaria rosae]|uniref:uncharacterized protein n=1 Tax=Alternaria rosae TaxID=1187941 RepID=UPI001E8DCFF8|nr:uncharacterized protein BKA58DRAFT_243025 [Alternaria rosae]KAH6865331.1 hypothetical protein BKA58DRAFT_243025 [Alternaria rosae]